MFGLVVIVNFKSFSRLHKEFLKDGISLVDKKISTVYSGACNF